MRTRNLTRILVLFLILLPAFAHAQGNDWTFNAPPLSDGFNPYNDLVVLMTGWAPPNVISGSEAVGWDSVDGVTSFDVILADVNDDLITVYATHGLYATEADFEYHFSSAVGLFADDITGVAMCYEGVVLAETGLGYEEDSYALGNAGIEQAVSVWPSIDFDEEATTAYNANYRYWELDFPTLTYGGETYRIGWFDSEYDSSEFFFGLPLSMGLGALDPADDINLTLIDFCQEDDCESMNAEIFRVALFWAAGEYANQGALETLLAGAIAPYFEDFEVTLFDTDPVFEAPNDYDDFTFVGWPTGVSGSSASLDFVGSVVDLHVFDADDASDIEEAECVVVNRNSGSPLVPYIAPVEGANGIYTFRLPEMPLRLDDDPWYNFAVTCTKTDYIQSYIYQLPAIAETPLEFPLMPIDVFTDLLVEELEYTSLDEDTGWVFGFSMWSGPYGWEPVGCAEASATGVDPADIHYTDSTVGMPTLTQPSTDPADPSFLMVNVPATTSGMTIDLETTYDTTSYSVPAIFENTLTFAFVLFDGETNPDGCE